MPSRDHGICLSPPSRRSLVQTVVADPAPNHLDDAVSGLPREIARCGTKVRLSDRSEDRVAQTNTRESVRGTAQAELSQRDPNHLIAPEVHSEIDVISVVRDTVHAK